MRTVVALLGLLLLGTGAPPLGGQARTTLPAVSIKDTYSTIHNLSRAHGITQGSGARVGILDHSFQAAAHSELFAGEMDFLPEAPSWDEGAGSHRGYWMALTFREIAPEAEIIALNTYHPDEDVRVDAMVRAIDWAAKEGLDVLTYCSEPFSHEAREKLDPAVTRAVEAGVVVVFSDYSHPLNILPAGLGQSMEEGQRDPDLNIFSYECVFAFAGQTLPLMNPDDDRISRYRPFLARPSAGPVTAGFVALMRSLAPATSPEDIKRILVETSRPVLYEGEPSARVPDAFEAVRRVVGTPAGP